VDIHYLYKPFRNYIRQFALPESLRVLHSYLQNLQFSEPIARDIERPPVGLGLGQTPHEWELELLCKEAILNAGPAGRRSLRKWNDFASAINKVRKLENEIYGFEPADRPNVLHEIFRIAHRQFPWQQNPNSSTLIRHYKIFSFPPLDAILQRELGLTAQQIFLIGLSLLGHFKAELSLAYPPKINIPPITQAQFDRFVTLFSVNMKTMREQIAGSQRYDADYAYSYNPMRRYPLVLSEDNGRQFLLAPIPTLLLRKFTNGIYYDVVSAVGFSDAYGPAFQEYVGQVLKVIEGPWHILAEESYQVGHDDKKTIDWIIRSADADLFIECKTKRLKADSKILSSSIGSLLDDLDKISDGIAQGYKALNDGLLGHYPQWKFENKPVYLVVTTIENWFLFNPQSQQHLLAQVREKVVAANLDANVVEQYPYILCDVENLEEALQIMAIVGIEAFMKRKLADDRRAWDLQGFISSEFKDESRKIKGNLFPKAFAEISPHLE
jgi:hypothetical protein